MFGYASASEEEKPFKVIHEVAAPHGRIARDAKRAAQVDVAKVDEELLYYLRGEATFRERNWELMQVLHAKAKKFLERYDTTTITYKERYHMCIKAASAAFDIPEEEQAVRQHLKNPVQEELRQKNHKLVKEAFVGHSGWGPFKSGHAIPKSA